MGNICCFGRFYRLLGDIIGFWAIFVAFGQFCCSTNTGKTISKKAVHCIVQNSPIHHVVKGRLKSAKNKSGQIFIRNVKNLIFSISILLPRFLLSLSLSLCLSRKKLSLLFNLYVSFLTLSFIFIFFQKMGHSHPLCSLFSSFQLQLTGHVQYKFLPMTGFEHQTSGAGSDRSTN